MIEMQRHAGTGNRRRNTRVQSAVEGAKPHIQVHDLPAKAIQAVEAIANLLSYVVNSYKVNLLVISIAMNLGKQDISFDMGLYLRTGFWTSVKRTQS